MLERLGCYPAHRGRDTMSDATIFVILGTIITIVFAIAFIKAGKNKDDEK